MNEMEILLLCLLVGVVGLTIVGGIIWFGYRLHIVGRNFGEPLLRDLFQYWLKGPPPYDDIPRHLAESYSWSTLLGVLKK